MRPRSSSLAQSFWFGGISGCIRIHYIVDPTKIWRANSVKLPLDRLKDFRLMRVQERLTASLLSRVSAAKMRHRLTNQCGHCRKPHTLKSLSRLRRKHTGRIGEELGESA